jgi:hypothetical protein
MISGPPAAVRMRAETSSQRWPFNRITRGKKTFLSHILCIVQCFCGYIHMQKEGVVRGGGGNVMKLESLRYCMYQRVLNDL